jgi:hypothetical protein
MTAAQIDLISSILANFGVGLLLTGALGPAIIQAPLRFGLPIVVTASWVSGTAFIFLAVYLRRN